MNPVFLLCLTALIELVQSHGFMSDPPSRNTMWREGFPNPVNVDDNGLNCGGMANQWYVHRGKCGACGDPYQGPRKHEAGYPGGYANGIIVREYRRGDTIQAKVKITANHKGYFIFKICPVNNKMRKVTQQCLDRYPLSDANGKERFSVWRTLGNRPGEMTVDLRLPPNLTCRQCVLQWTYKTGNNWGGHKENFVNCADVTIQ